jgi:hypothetical protein
MKRALLWSMVLSVSLGLTGCPVYPDDGGCFEDSDCGSGYACDYPSGACVRTTQPVECTKPADCAANYSCGEDNRCHAGSCAARGYRCVAGYVCDGSSGSWECVRDPGGPRLDAGIDPPADGSGKNDAGQADSSEDGARDSASDGTTGDASPEDAARGATDGRATD